MASTSDTYLHGHHDSVLRSHRWRTAENSAGYLLARLPADARVLDVGCGPGTITVDLAARVPDGQVTGIDAAGDVLAVARQEADRRGLPNVGFEVGDVYALGFDGPDRSTWCTRTRCCSTCPTRSRRWPRCGGCAGPGGWSPRATGTTAVSSGSLTTPGLTEWQALYRNVARALGGEPDAGRHLLSWARQAGFAAIEASASAWCYTGPEDRPWWGTSWAERLTESPFGDRAVEHGLATRQDLARLAEAWRRWAASEDGWLLIPHGEILCEVAA